jgi:hypothetical protein
MSPEGASALPHDAFAAAVLDPDRPVPAGIGRANGGDPQEAFNVYRNNVVVSLAEALKAAFPITSQLLGEGLQRALMADYARSHPPENAIMAHYGRGFDVFLRDHRATKARPFLADMATMERLRLDSYHAADAEVFDGAVLASLEPDVLAAGHFVLHPATRIFTSAFPVASIYGIELAQSRGEAPAEERHAIDMKERQAVLITRPAYEVFVNRIGLGDAAFLNACGAGLSFDEAAEAGFEADTLFDLQAALSLALSSGSLQGFQTPPNSRDGLARVDRSSTMEQSS